jgi:hypothetical protein
MKVKFKKMIMVGMESLRDGEMWDRVYGIGEIIPNVERITPCLNQDYSSILTEDQHYMIVPNEVIETI